MTGFQIEDVWMGRRIRTLADVWPARPVAMIVGINPAPTSVDAGHYYQGRAGQRQLGHLVRAGILPTPGSRFFEAAALSVGIGFTDIVKRPTAGEGDIGLDELDYGSRLLADRLREHDVDLMICVFSKAVKALLGTIEPPGFQPHRTAWGAEVFRMEGPYAPGSRAIAALAPLRDKLVP